MQVAHFIVKDIVHIDGKGLFAGTLEISKPDTAQMTNDFAKFSVKVTLSATSTLQEIEKALLNRAQNYSMELGQFLARHSPEELFQLRRQYEQSWSDSDIKHRGS